MAGRLSEDSMSAAVLDEKDVFLKYFEEARSKCSWIFSSSEAKGKFLDLNPLFSKLKTLKKLPQFDDYLLYLDFFADLDSIPVYLKNSNYADYISDLHTYLKDFYLRSNPMKNVSQIFSEIEADFDSKFLSLSLPGWKSELERVRGIAVHMEIYCVPCQKEFKNANSFRHHKKGKKHISAVNKGVGKGFPDTLDKADLVDPAEEKKINCMARLEFWIGMF